MIYKLPINYRQKMYKRLLFLMVIISKKRCIRLLERSSIKTCLIQNSEQLSGCVCIWMSHSFYKDDYLNKVANKFIQLTRFIEN